jgi:hypothetical protein
VIPLAMLEQLTIPPKILIRMTSTLGSDMSNLNTWYTLHYLQDPRSWLASFHWGE